MTNNFMMLKDFSDKILVILLWWNLDSETCQYFKYMHINKTVSSKRSRDAKITHGLSAYSG